MLCIVIEFDARRVLDPGKGSLFGVIAETVPLTISAMFVGLEPPRIDWVGGPNRPMSGSTIATLRMLSIFATSGISRHHLRLPTGFARCSASV